MHNLPYLNPKEFGFSKENLGYKAPDGSYEDKLFIYSPTITLGTVLGKFTDEVCDIVFQTWDANMRQLFIANGGRPIAHIVDYTHLPIPTPYMKTVGKEYFDRWFNEGIMSHQAIIGAPGPY